MTTLLDVHVLPSGKRSRTRTIREAFLESYRIVADHLERLPPGVEFDKARFLSECAGLGKQYHLQRRIRSTASISTVLFKTALQIAENREILDSQETDLATWRHAFAEEVRTAIRRVDAIDAIAASRRAGILD